MTFSLLLCGCGHAFVRSDKAGTSWTCPKCLDEDDVDNLIETLGPERDIDRAEEFDRLCGFPGATT